MSERAADRTHTIPLVFELGINLKELPGLLRVEGPGGSAAASILFSYNPVGQKKISNYYADARMSVGESVTLASSARQKGIAKIERRESSVVLSRERKFF